MINNRFKLKAIFLFSATAFVSSSTLASVAFQDPASASWGGWTRGDANTSFVHWDHIGGPDVLDIVDSTPDGGNSGVSSALLTPNNSGAFVTGGGAGGNIYSFSDTPDFTVFIQPDYSTPSGVGSVALQLKILGSDLDASSVKLGGLAWDSTKTLFSGDAGGPFGGLDKEYLFVWDEINLSSAVELGFKATGSSMSVDEVAVDIRETTGTPTPTPTPTPAAIDPIPIDGSLSGTYVVDGLLDQGFFITVSNDAQGSFIFVSWFTYGEFGQPLWLVGNDALSDGSTQITLTMQRLQGPNFMEQSISATRTDIGTMTFVAIDCETIQISFDFDSLGADDLTMKRLSNIQGRDCQ